MDDDGLLMTFLSEVANNDIDMGDNYFEYDLLWEHLLQDNNIAGIENIDINNLEFSGTTDCNETNIESQTITSKLGESSTTVQNSLSDNYAEHTLCANILSAQFDQNQIDQNDEIEAALQSYSEGENTVTLEHDSQTDNTVKGDLECESIIAQNDEIEAALQSYSEGENTVTLEHDSQTDNTVKGDLECDITLDKGLLSHKNKQTEPNKQDDFEHLTAEKSRENLLESTESKEIDCTDNQNILIVCQNAEKEEEKYNFTNYDDSPQEEGELIIDESEESTNDSCLDNQGSAAEDNLKATSNIEGLLFEIKGVAEKDLIICEICQYVFKSKYKKEIHHLKKHCVPEEKPVIETQKMSVSPDIQLLAKWVNGKKMYFCCVCSFKTRQYASMFRHITRIHDNGRFYNTPIFLCEVCGKMFKDQNYFRAHLKSHSTEPFVCEVCGKPMGSYASLLRHQVNSHSKDNNICCKLCDFKTNRKGLMYTHVEKHRKGAGLKCRFCGEMFFTKLALRRHCFSHSDAFPCEVCRVGYSSKVKAMNHKCKEKSTGVDPVQL